MNSIPPRYIIESVWEKIIGLWIEWDLIDRIKPFLVIISRKGTVFHYRNRIERMELR